MLQQMQSGMIRLSERYGAVNCNNKRCKGLRKNVELRGVAISVDKKIFSFSIRKSTKSTTKKNTFSRSNIVHLGT